MSRKNAMNAAKGQDVYVSFHMDNEFEQTCSNIKQILMREFDDDYKMVYSNNNDGEVIFWIKTPLNGNNSEMRGFFQQLHHIFNECSPYSPHFTSFDKDK